MKKYTFFCLLLIACCMFAYSQTVPVKKDSAKSKTVKAKTALKVEPPKVIIIPIPEFINQPYYYDQTDNKLIKLENTTAQLITKKKTLGLKGAKQYFSMNEASSKIRFTAKAHINFIIKTSGDVIDLTSYIKLYRFVSNNEKREVTITSKEGVLSDKEEEKGKFITMSVKTLSKDNYMIEFTQPLEAGEYGFVWVKNMELKEFNVFAFGINWKNSD